MSNLAILLGSIVSVLATCGYLYIRFIKHIKPGFSGLALFFSVDLGVLVAGAVDAFFSAKDYRVGGVFVGTLILLIGLLVINFRDRQPINRS